MKILVFQHQEGEHPGAFRDYMRADGVEWDTVHLYRGEAIPEFAPYDALIVMGGIMNVWDGQEYPWLIEEKRAIRTWIREVEKPYLGVCLGHQLAADALGGSCKWSSPPEIGICEARHTVKAKSDPLFGAQPDPIKCLHWHSVEVAQVPDGAVILAETELCPNQAMRIADHAWSTQYHVEAEPDTIEKWCAEKEHRDTLENTLGPGTYEIVRQNGAEAIPELLANSKNLYDRFTEHVRSLA